MSSLISNYIIGPQRLVVILDHIGLNIYEQKFLEKVINEQGGYKIKTLSICTALKKKKTLNEFIKQCDDDDTLGGQWNVILPDLADFICYQKPSVVFPFLKRLDESKFVKRVLLWVTVPNIAHNDASYLVAGVEYMASLTIHIETDKELRIITRKPGGAVTNQRFTYVQKPNEFEVTPIAITETKKIAEDEQYKVSDFGTFKIELEEEELVARNALKMPYEKTSEAEGGNIIYTPDANDDFDDEDPDEDLFI